MDTSEAGLIFLFESLSVSSTLSSVGQSVTLSSGFPYATTTISVNTFNLYGGRSPIPLAARLPATWLLASSSAPTQTVLAKQQVTDLNTSLDLPGLPKGLYFLRLQSGTSASSVRVVIQ